MPQAIRAEGDQSSPVPYQSASWPLDHQNMNIIIKYGVEVELNVGDNERPNCKEGGDDSRVVCHGVSVEEFAPFWTKLTSGRAPSG